MATIPQSYASHTRCHPLFHFFLVPVMLINFIWSIVLCYQSPSWTQCWWVVVSLGLIVMMFLVRTNSLKVQDRLIRHEEQLRCQRILPADLAQQASGMRVGQYIALRFAAGEELEGLVFQSLSDTGVPAPWIKMRAWHCQNRLR